MKGATRRMRRCRKVHQVTALSMAGQMDQTAYLSLVLCAKPSIRKPSVAEYGKKQQSSGFHGFLFLCVATFGFAVATFLEVFCFKLSKRRGPFREKTLRPSLLLNIRRK